MENTLRWFGHAERKPLDFVVSIVDQIDRSQTIRGNGRTRKTIGAFIKKDLEFNNLDKSMILNKTLW